MGMFRHISSFSKHLLRQIPIDSFNNNIRPVNFVKIQSYQYGKMADAKLEAVPAVEIDIGIFKYVLVKVFGKEQSDGTEPSKVIVRGYEDCEWHSDIYDRISASCKALGLDTECLGGGRIDHNSEAKLIKVYGYSQGFGKADHNETRNILRSAYSNYEIEISDDGY